MKKIQIIFLAFMTLMFGVSCENDGGTSLVSLSEGAVPNMVKSPVADPIIDLLSIINGDPVNLAFSAEVAQGKPVSTDIVGVYKALAGPVYNATLFNDVNLPQDFTLTGDDIVAAFAELTSTSDILLGDVLSITARFTMADGTVLNIINDDGTNNTGTNIQTTVLFTSVINYPVSCPSDLSGTYLVTSTGVGCCGVAPITDYQYTVTVTDNGGGSYALSDYSGGAYDGLFCGPFGICGDASGGNITDICGTLGGSAPDCCGSTIDFTGTVDPNTGDWTVEVTSGFLAATSVWVKQ